MLAACFDSQKTFGQKFEKLDSIAKTFAWRLAPFSMEEITAAFAYHIDNAPEFPTISCIRKLIQGEPPKLSASYYNSLIQRQAQGNQLSFAEQNFKEKFEAQQQHLADYKPPAKRETKALANYPKHIAQIGGE